MRRARLDRLTLTRRPEARPGLATILVGLCGFYWRVESRE